MKTVAAETNQASRTIHFNLFANARSKAPAEQVAIDWPGLCDRLERLARSTARPNADKRNLPAWTAAEMSEAYNTNVNVTALTALPIDVDTADADLLELCELSGLSLFVYATPSDPNPDGTRRLRIVAELTRPIFPAEVEHARLALAEHLEIGPGQGVETAKAVSQVMFSGRLHGAPKRETWRFAGDALDVDELMARPLAKPWKRSAKPGQVKALARVAHADPDERTAALLEALEPHWEAPGEATGRRQVLRALGGYLARRGWPDEQIAAVGRGLETERPEALRVATMLECARAARLDDNAAGWSSLAEWSPDAAAVIESVAKDPREPNGFPGVWVPAFARMFERAAAARVTAANDADADPLRGAGTPAADNAPSAPLILRSKRGQVLTLLWEGDELGHRPLAEKNLRLRIKELGYDHSMVPLFAKGGKPHSTDRLVEDHGATYTHTAYAFANRVTTYDPTGEGRVVIGYPLAVMPGRFDADADTWLRALAGAHYDRLAVWIASCSQANINRLSACLILMGRADSGKSMLGHAVARMWGQAPPALSLITAQFNADLLRCPILVDEEAQLLGSKELSTKKFRDVIQSSARSVEFKGLERSELYGGLRAVVSCNGFSDLRFKDLGGPAVIEALRDRMLVLNATERTDACKAPLARLRPDPNDHRVDLGRVAGHLAWLCETVTLPAERFLGAGGDETEAAILSSLTEEHAELWETFRNWLDTDGAGEAWSARLGLLCANPAALALALERTGRGWDLPRARSALAPFVEIKDYQPRDGGTRPRLWALDGKRVADSLDLGAEARAALTAKLDASKRPAQPRHRGRFGLVR